MEECRAWALPPSTSSPVGLAQHSDENVAFDLYSVDALSEIRISAPPALARPSADVRHSALKTKATNVATYELPPKIGPPIHSKRMSSKRIESGTNQDQALPTPACPVAPPLLPSRGPSPAPSVPHSRHSTPAPPLPSFHVLSPEPPMSAPGRALADPTSAACAASSLPPQPSTTPVPTPAPQLAQPQTTIASNAAAGQSSLESRKHPREDNDGGDKDGHNEGRSKRTRTSASCQATTATTTDAPDPASAASHVVSDDDDDEASPEWFRKAILMLASKDLGGGWMDLISSWRRFEKAAGYTEVEILSSTGRPPCVGAWISRARIPNYQPPLSSKNLKGLEQSFWKWWRALQPQYRKVIEARDGAILPQIVGDMETIRRPGKNGLLSVLAALWFWGSAPAVVQSGTVTSWGAAVDDVSWVIEQLTNSPTNTA